MVAAEGRACPRAAPSFPSSIPTLPDSGPLSLLTGLYCTGLSGFPSSHSDTHQNTCYLNKKPSRAPQPVPQYGVRASYRPAPALPAQPALTSFSGMCPFLSGFVSLHLCALSGPLPHSNRVIPQPFTNAANLGSSRSQVSVCLSHEG